MQKSIIVDIEWQKQFKNPKTTIWNFREQEGLQTFKRISETVKIKEEWDLPGNADEKYSRWYKQFKSLLYSSFRRITIKGQQTSPTIQSIIDRQRKLTKVQASLRKMNMEGGLIYKNIQNKIEKAIEEILIEQQRETAERAQRKMNAILEGKTHREDIWSVRKTATKQVEAIMALKDESDNIITDPEKIQKRYINYYTDLLQPRIPDNDAEETIKEYEKCFNYLMQVKTHDDETINKCFTEKELTKVINKLKINKSPGDDSITNELLKASGKNLRNSLLNMINWIHKNEQIPTQLLHINIKSLFKGKGSTSDLKNHTRIFISSAILKLLEGLIAERTTPIIDKNGFTETQAGGRTNRGIADQLFTLRAVMDQYSYLDKPLYIEFIDLVKAFDKMVLKNVMIDLWNAGVKGTIWRNIYNINKQAFIKIKTPLGLTPDAEIGETLKQGSVLASTLAALHTDGVNKMFSNNEAGISYGDVKINQLLFQDDILKVEDDPQKLNSSNEIYTWFAKVNRMRYHDEKSMFISTKKQEAEINLAGYKIKEFQKYKYLADIITPSGNLDETIHQRKNQILGITAELSTIISLIDETGLHISTAIAYYKAIIIPKLLTNSETWNNISPTNMNELEAIQNKSIKRLLRLPQGTPSQALRNELGICDIKTAIFNKKLMYLHKIINYPENNLTRKVLFSQMQQPGKTWWSSLTEMCTEINLEFTIEDLTNTSKYQWKKQVKAKLHKYQEQIFNEWTKTSTKCQYMKPSAKMQEYLCQLNKGEAMTILKERTRMTLVKTNYKNMYDNTLCRLCQVADETTLHLIQCYNANNPENLQITSSLEEVINNISSHSIDKIRRLAQIINQVLEALTSTSDVVPTITCRDGASDTEEGHPISK